MRKLIKNLHQRFVTALAVAGLSLLSQGVQAQSETSGSDKIDYAALQTGMDELTVALKKTRADINRSSFEPSALVEHLEFEAEPAIDFVGTDEVADRKDVLGFVA